MEIFWIIQVVHPLMKNVVFKVSIKASSIYVPVGCTVYWMAVVHVHVEININTKIVICKLVISKFPLDHTKLDNQQMDTHRIIVTTKSSVFVRKLNTF